MKKHIWAAIFFLLTFLLITIGVHFLSAHTQELSASPQRPADVFQTIAVSLIITWILFLITYYVWAIEFYNVNLGWTDEDWAAKSGIKPNPDGKTSPDISTVTSTNVTSEEPKENPNAGESLGLPTGTVRATIALSLLIAGLSMTIASFSMNNTYPLNSLFIDNFEFFKTGFLMMIAFYFGAKSLDILRNTNNAAIVTKGENALKRPGAATTASQAPEADDTSPQGASNPATVFNDPTARG
jgi:hypothetical protein